MKIVHYIEIGFLQKSCVTAPRPESRHKLEFKKQFSFDCLTVYTFSLFQTSYASIAIPVSFLTYLYLETNIQQLPKKQFLCPLFSTI